MTDANFDFLNQGVCGPRSDRPGVWYEITGRGAEVTIKVCTNNNIITDYGVFLACNSQDCEGFPPQTYEPADCDLNQTKDFSFMAKKNAQYYVQVRSDIVNGEGSNFTIVYDDSSLSGPTLAPESSKNPSQINGSGQGRVGVALALLAVASTVMAALW